MRVLFLLLATACSGVDPVGTDDNDAQTDEASTETTSVTDTGPFGPDSLQNCVKPFEAAPAQNLRWKTITVGYEEFPGYVVGYSCPNGHHAIRVSMPLPPDEPFEAGDEQLFVYDAEGAWIGRGTWTDAECGSWDNTLWEGVPALRKDCPPPTDCDSDPCWRFNEDAPL